MLALVAVYSCQRTEPGQHAQPVKSAQPVAITEFSPRSGGRGTLVTVVGPGIGDSVNVFFGGTRAGGSLRIPAAAGRVAVPVPPHARSGPIGIVVDHGETSADAQSTQSFTVLNETPLPPPPLGQKPGYCDVWSTDCTTNSDPVTRWGCRLARLDADCN